MRSIKSELKKAKGILEAKGVKTPFLDAEIILSYSLGKSREYLHTYPEKKMSLLKTLRYRRLAAKRTSKTPLAYITGKKEFAGLEFNVGPGVLVPRPETEKMVDLAWAEIKRMDKNNKNVIDVGTGSGCIGITLALWAKNAGIGVKFTGLDASNRALGFARENTKKLGVDGDIKFARSNLLSYFLGNKDRLAKLNIITANLPYLIKEEYEQEVSIRKEPREALISGEGGLGHYRKLFEQIKKLEPLGLKFIIFCEISPHQAKKISDLSMMVLGRRAKVHNDMAGRERIAEVRVLSNPSQSPLENGRR